MKNNEKILFFQKEILSFWDAHGRKDLPWRKTKDPWSILLSELLLRKTTSKQAIPVFEKISSINMLSLAKMKVDEIELIIRPLGISRVRAHQIKSTAEIICEAGTTALHSIQFLESLPGVGKYTVNSVLCFAFGLPKPALDTNMIRILERVFNFNSRRSRPREDKELWEFASSLVPSDECREYNWGVLDFGALICKSRKPNCAECQIAKVCIYYKDKVVF